MLKFSHAHFLVIRKVCVWNKVFLLGPAYLFFLQRHYLYLLPAYKVQGKAIFSQVSVRPRGDTPASGPRSFTAGTPLSCHWFCLKSCPRSRWGRGRVYSFQDPGIPPARTGVPPAWTWVPLPPSQDWGIPRLGLGDKDWRARDATPGAVRLLRSSRGTFLL